MVGRRRRAGLQVSIHAIGDRASTRRWTSSTGCNGQARARPAAALEHAAHAPARLRASPRVERSRRPAYHAMRRPVRGEAHRLSECMTTYAFRTSSTTASTCNSLRLAVAPRPILGIDAAVKPGHARRKEPDAVPSRGSRGRGGAAYRWRTLAAFMKPRPVHHARKYADLVLLDQTSSHPPSPDQGHEVDLTVLGARSSTSDAAVR